MKTSNFNLVLLDNKMTMLMMTLVSIMIMIIAVIRRRRINNYCNSKAESVTCYSLQPLRHEFLQTNNLNSLENPMKFTKADERFFYFKNTGNNAAFEAMHNGSECINSIKTRFCFQ
jgi:sorbitol-specific phosphotransferase system component IIC